LRPTGEVKGGQRAVEVWVVDVAREPPEYFVLAYDAATMEVRSFTGHGRDFVGAILNLVTRIERHGDEPGVVVRLFAASSFGELPERYPDPFRALKFTEGR
jgi:hypothetical protein